MKNSVYIYPNVTAARLGSNNPYLVNLRNSLNNAGLAVFGKTSEYAFPDLLINSFHSDVIILNWIEDLPERRFGVLQTWLFYSFIWLSKKRKKKIIWIKHNKLSHSRRKINAKKGLQKALLKYADHIIVHSSDVNLESDKVIFLHHPNEIELTNAIGLKHAGEPNIDLLLWGEISEYKVILEFLEYAKTSIFLNKLNITIVGRCKNAEYYKKLEIIKTANVTLINKFIEEDELKKLFNQTRFILFTYKETSVMSSGCLIDSLSAGKLIIGSRCGAFFDMEKGEGFVRTFDTYADIEAIVKQNFNNYKLSFDDIKQFLDKNSWEKFGQKIYSILYKSN